MRAVGGDRVGVAVDARAAAGRRARAPAVRGCAQIVAHSTNGTRARRAPSHAAGSATRPEIPATTARKRPDAASRSHAALARPQRPGTGSVGPRRPAPAAVADVAADQREHGALALVQRPERADAERRRVVGDEQDGPRVGSPQRLLVGGDGRLAAARPGERGLDGRARLAARARAARPARRAAPRSSAASASGSPGATSRMPPPAAAISSGPGSPRQPIAGTPRRHRLDVGDAERLVDAREHEHARRGARSRPPRRAGAGR